MENSSNNDLTGRLQDHCTRSAVNRFQHAKQRRHRDIVVRYSQYFSYIIFFFGHTLIRNLALTGGSTTVWPTRSSYIAKEPFSSQQGYMSIFSWLIIFFHFFLLLSFEGIACHWRPIDPSHRAIGLTNWGVVWKPGWKKLNVAPQLFVRQNFSSSIRSQVFTKTRVNISFRVWFNFLQVLHLSSFKDYRGWTITHVWGGSAFEAHWHWTHKSVRWRITVDASRKQTTVGSRELEVTLRGKDGDHWSRRTSITAMELPQLNRGAHYSQMHKLSFTYFPICCPPFYECSCVLIWCCVHVCDRVMLRVDVWNDVMICVVRCGRTMLRDVGACRCWTGH